MPMLPESLTVMSTQQVKAKNTIGGIAGDSGRALIANCHVEGSIEATENPRWGGGPKAGGIVGNLAPDYSALNPDNEQMNRQARC